jgi:hypothetical protein
VLPPKTPYHNRPNTLNLVWDPYYGYWICENILITCLLSCNLGWGYVCGENPFFFADDLLQNKPETYFGNPITDLLFPFPLN